MPRRVDYVFLPNIEGEGYPALIEISSRAHTTFDNLFFCSGRLVHPRIEMHPLLKVLKHPSIFVSLDRGEILNELCKISKNDNNLIIDNSKS